jgi:hypothetical protein
LTVSGHQDLLVLQAFEAIPIVTATQALEWLKGLRDATVTCGALHLEKLSA